MSVENSRRVFLKNVALGTGGVAAMGVIGGGESEASPAPSQKASPASEPAPVTQELPIPATYEADRPKQTEYAVDVLVIGGGYAGINAAYMAKQAGKDVLLVDKGRPGFSGQSAWPGTHHFFDKSMGDDPNAYREMMRYGGEFTANLNWIETWMNESKETYERVKSWGILEQFPRIFDTPYWKNHDVVGYRENIVGDKDRRFKFTEMLDKNKIPYIVHTMITHVIVQNGKAVGAVGFQATTGAIVTIHAKAVVMCTGTGSIHPTGHCVGGDTFDGEFIAYNLGLPIAGKEYEDYHVSNSFASNNAWVDTDSSYIDNIWLTGGFCNEEYAERFKQQSLDPKKKPMHANGLPYLEKQVLPTKTDNPIARSLAYGKNPNEVRTGKMVSPRLRADAPGAAPGMCLHLASGVFCGLDDLSGVTGIPGLFVAGDGTYAAQVGGASYTMGHGFTSNFVSLSGAHAAKAAVAYCDKTPLEKIADEKLAQAKEEIQHPLTLKEGHNPMWARDVLLGIMAPYYVSKNKSEVTLKAALANVEYLRDHVAPRLLARSSHDLRMCHEVKHKIQASENKLRASLARQESRGYHFREDFPERNDAKFQGYILVQKGEDGKAKTSFVAAKPEWTDKGAPAAKKANSESGAMHHER